jgi:formiminoglutamase
MTQLIHFTPDDLTRLLSPRAGETKIGQRVQLLDAQLARPAALAQARQAGARFAIIGVGEDIGPRANLGRGGATDAFEPAVKQLLNLQSNRFLDGVEILIAGQLETEDLQLGTDAPLETLRHNVQQLDKRVIQLATEILDAGLEPIVIGGGHNNAYGLLMAVKASTGKSAAAVNLDPHSDFRLREGRHSGNGFSYAAASGALEHYHVLGLHELKNSEANLAQLSAFGGSWHSLQSIWVRREISLPQALEDIARGLNNAELPVALELDLDAIVNMPSSASTAAGIPLLDAAFYVNYIASHCPCAYLHLAEAAPACHDAGITAGYRETGQSISELIYAYVQGRLTSF